jgi:hypothetical protein
MMALLGTGHSYAANGHLLRVDVICGRWVATRFASNLVVTQQVFGTNHSVHEQIALWSSPRGRH